VRRAFSAKRLRSLSAIVEALLSQDTEAGLVPPSPELTHRVVDELDVWIGAGSPDLGRGYRILSWLIEWLPIVVIGAVARASGLSLARRLAYLEKLERARFVFFAPLVAAFKVPITMLAFELDPELHSTGFDRAMVSTPRTVMRRLKVHAG
jgi:hypothetical protein